ncbi:MAG TPA: rhomboid family intramembrane serine protease [Acidimicrobiales bacterium]|nr:rhomboid family intramembrane serine protease [Acidimicrobiales bacterium]
MSSTEPVAPPRCYVHADRLAGSTCRRCGRPICPDCMHEAPVGWQCTNCVRQGARVSPATRWRPRPAGGAGRLGNTRMTPAVIGLIAINAVIYGWESRHMASTIRRFAMWPDGVHFYGQWYRLITGAFLHASIEHILFNMVTLAIVGPPVEAEIGKVRFVALYLLSALGGSVASYLLSAPDVAGVGASGAIFGVMGGYYVLARRRRWETRTIVVLIGINLLLGFTNPGIDWRAHLGGMIVGALTCYGLTALPGARRAHSGGAAGWAVGRPGTEVAQLVQGVAVVIAALVVLGLLVLLPPGHVNL